MHLQKVLNCVCLYSCIHLYLHKGTEKGYTTDLSTKGLEMGVWDGGREDGKMNIDMGTRF